MAKKLFFPFSCENEITMIVIILWNKRGLTLPGSKKKKIQESINPENIIQGN